MSNFFFYNHSFIILNLPGRSDVETQGSVPVKSLGFFKFSKIKFYSYHYNLGTSEWRFRARNAQKYSPWLRICIATGDAYMAWEGQHHLLSQIDQSITPQLRSQAKCPRWWKTLKTRIPTSLRRLVSMNNICYAAMFYRAFSDNTPLSRMFTMWNSVAQ